MFKCANCLIECPREIMRTVEELDGDNLILLEICPQCVEYRGLELEEKHRPQTMIVTREMAMDGGCPEMEGREILW